MSRHTGPMFFELSPDDAIELLTRNHVGRLAFTFKERVDIEPISYVFDDGWLYLRTSPGTKLTTVRHHPWVAFEVDEVKSQVEWRSVVVHGTIYFIDPDLGEREQEAHDAAVRVFRTVYADAFTERDTNPERRSLFRIHADEIVGRGASPRRPAPRGSPHGGGPGFP